MLDVSFLPVPGQSREELDEDASDVDSEFQPPSVDTLSGLAVDTSDNRISSWLNASSDAVCESMGEAGQSEVENKPPQSLSRDSAQLTPTRTQSDKVSGQEEKEDSPERDLPGSIVPPDTPDLGETEFPNVTSPVKMTNSQTDSQTPTQAQGPETQVVRTRTGRVVKAVNRLIDNMVHKPLTKDFVKGVNRRSLSLLTLF